MNLFRPLSTLALLTAVFLAIPASAQRTSKKNKPAVIGPTAAADRIHSAGQRRHMERSGPLSLSPFRCVGPTIMSGRVVDLEVDPDDPTHFYVAYATGGVWVTYSNGVHFEPLFQDEGVMAIGDIAVDWDHGERIWVGTGENNSSRSSYSGTGIYRSDDLGRTWQWAGLPESHHIGRIVLHPQDPNSLWVAAMGPLYSTNDQTGVFHSSDGGATWKQQFYLEGTGAIDLVIDPNDPSVLYTAIWQRTRTAWNFVESGPKSGVYRTLDGGDNWACITHSGSGFPQGEGVGRIGLSIAGTVDGSIVYCLLDNQFHRSEDTAATPEKKGISRKDFMTMDRGALLVLADSTLQQFLDDNGFPEKYTAQWIKEEVRAGRLEPIALYDYLYDANEDLFNTPIIGAQVYRWNGKDGAVWQRTHEGYLDDLVYTYGYYFGLIRVHPKNPDKLYIAGVPLLTSDDGGKSWRGINPENVHVDHHALWINPERPGHLINGSDGGVQITYDDGAHFINCNTPEVGQFYTVSVDNATPYNVYGGLQDNGVWVGPSTNTPNTNWHVEGKYPFSFLMGGDGMQVQVDTRTNQTVYTGYQFGHYSRLDRDSGEDQYIHPSHELGERPLRWNWQTPILLSQWNQDILYICSNKVHRSTDRGTNFTTISGDLTHGERKGDVPYGTLTCIAESPVQFGLLAVGSDDGRVHTSLDNGYSWNDVSAGLPGGLWVSRVVLSKHSRERIYVSLNGYRQDHFAPYIYVSEDLGKTWKRLSEKLPLEAVNVIREDPRDGRILYCGTDHGVYVSLDRGETWNSFGSKDLPAVPVHDLAIQERELDLVVGTHGRSIWIGSIEHLPALVGLDSLALFPVEDIAHRPGWGNGWSRWLPASEPRLDFYAFFPDTGEAVIEVRSADGDQIIAWTESITQAGFRPLKWDLSIEEEVFRHLNGTTADETIRPAGNGKFYLTPGMYQLTIRMGDHTTERSFNILDPKKKE